MSRPLQTLKVASELPDELTIEANRMGSDKGNHAFGQHHYTRVYSALFEPLRKQPVRILELGLLHNRHSAWKHNLGGKVGNPELRNSGDTSASSAPSLKMWASYFYNGEVFGFDINDFKDTKIPRCTIFQGDMEKREDLARMIAESGGSFDIVIDDASHASHHQQIALAAIFPALKPGGLYIIEDLIWQPDGLEKQETRKTRELLREAEFTGKFDSNCMNDKENAYLSEWVESIEMFDSLSKKNTLQNRDALAIIRKKQATVS